MVQMQFGICLRAALVLGIFAGFWRQTDGQNHFENLVDTSGVEKADIILELLWRGIEIDANGTIRIQDEELASLRPAKQVLHIFQHEIQKNPARIEANLKHLSRSDVPLSPKEFEQLLFTAVYCAYQIRFIQGLDKNTWINLFSQLVTEIVREICKQFCPVETMDSVQHLASRPWQEMPFYIAALKKSYRSNLAVRQRH